MNIYDHSDLHPEVYDEGSKMNARQEQIDKIYHTLDEFGLGALADEIASHLVDSGCRFADDLKAEIADLKKANEELEKELQAYDDYDERNNAYQDKLLKENENLKKAVTSEGLGVEEIYTILHNAHYEDCSMNVECDCSIDSCSKAIHEAQTKYKKELPNKEK